MDEAQIRAIVRDEMARHGPLDPLYTFEVASAAVPCSRRSLMDWLKRGAFPVRYSWQGMIRTRMVLASEVRWVRDHMMRKRRTVQKTEDELGQALR